MQLRDNKVDDTTPNTMFVGLYFSNDPAIKPDGSNEALIFDLKNYRSAMENSLMLNYF